MPVLKNPDHERAVVEYIKNGGSKTDIWQKFADPDTKANKNTINHRASMFFLRDDVIARMDEIREDVDITNLHSINRILDEFGMIAYANIVDIFDYEEATGKLMLIGGAGKLTELPREVTACIQSLKQTKDGVEVKLYPKDAALAQIAKIKGYFAPEKMLHAETSLADLLKNT